MKNKMLIPGVALWRSGERTAAAGGWVLIVVCVLAVLGQLVTPGAFAALPRAPMAHTCLWIGVPSVILYTSELFWQLPWRTRCCIAAEHIWCCRPLDGEGPG